MSLIAAAVFFVLLALSFPVAHALLIGATLGVLSSENLSLLGIIQQLYLPTQSFPWDPLESTCRHASLSIL